MSFDSLEKEDQAVHQPKITLQTSKNLSQLQDTLYEDYESPKNCLSTKASKKSEGMIRRYTTCEKIVKLESDWNT